MRCCIPRSSPPPTKEFSGLSRVQRIKRIASSKMDITPCKTFPFACAACDSCCPCSSLYLRFERNKFCIKSTLIYFEKQLGIKVTRGYCTPLPPPFVPDGRTFRQPLGHLLISRSTDQSELVPTTREKRAKRARFPFSICYSSILSPSPLLPCPQPSRRLLVSAPGLDISVGSCYAKRIRVKYFPGHCRIHCTEPTPTIFGVR